MKEENNKDQKTIQEKKKNKNIKQFVFVPRKTFNGIFFNSSIEAVLKKIGKPDKIFIDKNTSQNEISKSYYFQKTNITINYQKFGNVEEPLTFHSNTVYFENTNLFLLNKTELFEVVKKYFVDNNLNFDFNETNLDDELQFDFTEIGLTIWFQNNIITDICLYLPD